MFSNYNVFSIHTVFSINTVFLSPDEGVVIPPEDISAAESESVMFTCTLGNPAINAVTNVQWCVFSLCQKIISLLPNSSSSSKLLRLNKIVVVNTACVLLFYNLSSE